MTTVLVGQPVGADEVVADYLDHVATLGLSGRAVRDRIRIARDFTARHRDLHAWMTLPAAERIAEIRDTGAWPLICHTIGTGRLRLDVELAAVKQLTGLGRAVEDRDPSGFAALRNAGIRLGWRSSWVETVLGECLAVVLAHHGGMVADLTGDALDDFDAALSRTVVPPSSRRAYRGGWPACGSCCSRPRSSTPRRNAGGGPVASSSASPRWRCPTRSVRRCCATSACARRCCGPNRSSR
ncbi:phage integrase family domain protein [Mycobacterium avium MAV_120809_2495]|nr:hypothetical protein [Mycobacterium avium]ETZ42918.1 phage integrase family domain protein [Mycobacterium avium MAV_120809_2495]